MSTSTNREPAAVTEALADYRHGTINIAELRKRLADLAAADPTHAAYIERELAWTRAPGNDKVEWL
jgi:hypothetical protein